MELKRIDAASTAASDDSLQTESLLQVLLPLLQTLSLLPKNLVGLDVVAAEEKEEE